MRGIAILLLAAIPAAAAEDGWAKVRRLKSGTELRIYKKSGTQPLTGKMDEASDENLIAVFKNQQIAIPKDQIDRIDFRPLQTGIRVNRESKTTTQVDTKVKPPGPFERAGSPSTTTSSGSSLSINSKPGFETIYRRAVGTDLK